MKNMSVILIIVLFIISCQSNNEVRDEKDNSNTHEQTSEEKLYEKEKSKFKYYYIMATAGGWTVMADLSGQSVAVEAILLKDGDSMENCKAFCTIVHRLLPDKNGLETFAGYQLSARIDKMKELGYTINLVGWDSYPEETEFNFNQYLSLQLEIIDPDNEIYYEKLINYRRGLDAYIVSYVSEDLDEIDDSEIRLLLDTFSLVK